MRLTHFSAYGTLRAGNTADLKSDRTFTGQKQDGTGLLYYNARYYDPALGTFISPDTLVPDPGLVFDYNRYMYVRGNPLKYVDPTGHCATTSSGGEDWSDSECWGAAHSILNMWDDTDYWSSRYTSKDVFRQIAARNDLDAAWMNQELNMFFQSDSGQQWSQRIGIDNRPFSPDLGDYTSLNLSVPGFQLAIIRDDAGTWYVRGGLGAGFPSASLTRGDIFVNIGSGSENAYIDIDQLNISQADKALLMQDALTGYSGGFSAGFRFLEVGGSWSVTHEIPRYIMTEAGISNSPGGSFYVSPIARTRILYSR
jgi:RHS repeat-associated protein